MAIDPELTQLIPAERGEVIPTHGFLIIRLLSDKGGTSDVYEAYQPSLARKVVAKRIKAELLVNREMKEQFQEEAFYLARLSHPHIVQIIDYNREDLTLFLEYVDGSTLAEVLQREAKLPLEKVLLIISQTLLGLQYVHEKNIIHGDIKPGNVFLTKEGDVKIADFGIARIIGRNTTVSRKTENNFWIGTPAYMSPEHFTTGAVDARSDIYAVGVMLYRMLVGRPPFNNENTTKIAMMHVHDFPAFPDDFAENLPDELRRIILKALAKSPDERYQSALEFRTEISLLLYPLNNAKYLLEAAKDLKIAEGQWFLKKKPLLANALKLSQMALKEDPKSAPALQMMAEVKANLHKARNTVGFVATAAALILLLAVTVVIRYSMKGYGTLDVITNEPADVYLNGQKIGTAPFVFRNIPSGEQSFFVQQSGFYRSPESRILIEKGKVRNVEIAIPPGGTVSITSVSPGSAVRIDGAEKGQTPLTIKLPIGVHSIQVGGAREEVTVVENAQIGVASEN